VAYESFVQDLARCEPGLSSFVRPLVPTWDDMEEVMQQTCVVLWRKYEEFEGGTNFLSWACSVARFEVLRLRRRRARDRHLFGEELINLMADEGAAESTRRERELRALDGCMERLPPQQRELVRQCYADGVTIKQTAGVVGCSATALYKSLNRIRLALLECIEQTLSQEQEVTP
jgi:RNA polymerase sigma-70 factor (ECF subfamily)